MEITLNKQEVLDLLSREGVKFADLEKYEIATIKAVYPAFKGEEGFSTKWTLGFDCSKEERIEFRQVSEEFNDAFWAFVIEALDGRKL